MLAWEVSVEDVLTDGDVVVENVVSNQRVLCLVCGCCHKIKAGGNLG